MGQIENPQQRPPEKSLLTELYNLGKSSEIIDRVANMEEKDLSDLEKELRTARDLPPARILEGIREGIKIHKKKELFKMKLDALRSLVEGPARNSNLLEGTRDATKHGVTEKDRLGLAAETASIIGVGRSLLEFHSEDAEKAGFKEASDADMLSVGNMLIDGRVGTIPVSVLMDVKSLEDIQRMNSNKSWKLESTQIKALLFLSMVCKRRFEDVQHGMRAIDPNADAMKLSVREFFIQSKSLTEYFERFAGKFKEKLKGKSWKDLSPADMRESITEAFKFDLRENFSQDKQLAEHLEKLGLQKNEHGIFAEYYLAAKNVSMNILRDGGFRPQKLFEGKQLDAETYKRFEKIIVLMHEYLLSKESNALQYLKLYTHNEGLSGHRKYADILEEYLRRPDMRAGDVADLYIALQMAEHKSNGALPSNAENTTANGGFLLQMKILQIISDANEDHGKAFKAFLMWEAAKSVTEKGSELQLPPRALQGLHEVAKLAEGTVIKKINPIETTSDFAWDVALFVSGILGGSPEFWYWFQMVSLSAGTTMALNTLVTKLRTSGLHYTNKERSAGRALGSRYAELDVVRPLRRFYRNATPILGTRDALKAEQEMSRLLDQYDQFKKAVPNLSREKIDHIAEAKKVLESGKQVPEVKEMLKQRGFTDVEATNIMNTDAFTSVTRARQALSNAGRTPTSPDAAKRAADAGKSGVKPVETDPNAGGNGNTKGPGGGRKG